MSINNNDILKRFRELIFKRERDKLQDKRNQLVEEDEAVCKVRAIMADVNKQIEEYEKLKLDKEIMDNIKRTFDINPVITASTRTKIEEETKYFDIRMEKFCEFLNTVYARLSICENCEQITSVLKAYNIFNDIGLYNVLFDIEEDI